MKKQVERLSKEDYQRMITFFVATRGTCDRLRAATTLWDEVGRMISIGYNGSPPGDLHCDEKGHLLVDDHCIRTIHGERNAIFNTVNLKKLKSATARMLGTPCYNCVKDLVTNGIITIDILSPYNNSLGIENVEDLCRRKNVKLIFTKFDFVKVLQQSVDFLQGPGGPLKDLQDIQVKYKGENK